MGESAREVGCPSLSSSLLFSLLSLPFPFFIYLRDLAALMVAPDQGDAVRVPHFEGEQQAKGFDGVETPVDKVAEEEVVCAGGGIPDPKQFQEVVKLAVNVAA